MKRTIRVGLAVVAGLAVLILLYPSLCADSGSAPCDTWVGTRVPELPNAVLIGAVVGTGVFVWAMLGVTSLGERNTANDGAKISSD